MKKLFYLLLVLAMFGLTFTSCKKSKNNESNNGSSSKSWKIGDHTYKQMMCMGEGKSGSYNLIAMANLNQSEANPQNNLILVQFLQRPIAGTYKIMLKPGVTPAADEAVVSGIETINGVQYSATAENGSGTVTVKVENGKLNVTIPKVKAWYKPNSDPLDANTPSTTIEGNIVEQ